jgi:WD40 repeat protein/transcriptional regulator with XRE-family HTH domain
MFQAFNYAALVRARIELNLTQEQVAAAVGIDVRTYRRYESGAVNQGREGFSVRQPARRRLMERLCAELGLSEDELLVEVPAPPAQEAGASASGGPARGHDEPSPGSGDDFLSRVEQLCRLRSPDGTQIERFEAPAPFGRYLRVCESHGGLTRIAPTAALEGGLSEEALAVFFDAIDAPYRRSDPGLISTVVYGGAPVTEALSIKARERRVLLISFIEYQGLIDFRDYLAWQTRRLERDPVYPPSLYVDQRIGISVGMEESIHEEAVGVLRELLTSDYGRFVLILGDFGTGKTFLLHETALRMAKEGSPVIPVLIEMRRLEKARDLDALVAQHLALAGVQRIELKAFRHMLSEGRIALFFDGFDELALRVTYDRAVEHFDALIQAAQGRAAKVVVTSRTQHFLSERQVRTKLAEQAALIPGYRLAKLQPFDAARIRRFLANRLGSEKAADARMGLLADVKDLLGLSENPRMLSFIADIDERELYAAKARDGEVTSAGLYKLLLEKWLVHEYDRMHPRGAQESLSVEQRWAAVTDLAMRLWRQSERSVRISNLPESLGAALAAIGKHKVDLGVMVHQIGSGTLLVWDEEESFRFIHQSILEWLVAKEAAAELERDGDAASLAYGEVSPPMVDFFIAMAGLERARAWASAKVAAPAAEQDPAKKNALRVLQRLAGKADGEVPAAAAPPDLEGEDLRGQSFTGGRLRGANLMRANLAHVTLAKADLAGARLQGATLVGADLTEASLAGADLTGATLDQACLLGADLAGATLAGASLRRAKLIGASLAKVAMDGCDTFGASPSQGAAVEPTWALRSCCHALAFSPDGALLVSGHEDGTVRIWDAATGSAIRVLKGHPATVGSVAIRSDGKVIASASEHDDGAVRLWDIESGAPLRVLEGHSGDVVGIAFSPSGELLASASWDATVRLWRVDSGVPIRALEGHSSSVTAVAWSPDGETLASASDDRTVRLWHVGSPSPLHILQHRGGPIGGVAFSPDGETLAVALRSVCLWDVASGALLRVIDESVGATGVAISPDGSTLAFVSRGSVVRLWDRSSPYPSPRFLEGHTDSVTAVAWSPAGKILASASRDDTVRLWHVSTWSPLRVLKGHSRKVNSVAVSPDGATIAATYDDGVVRLWDAIHGSPLRTLEGRSDSVTRAAWSPDGEILASASLDYAVQLWDVASGSSSSERMLEGHSSRVTGVAISPDGKILASASADNTVRLWQVASGSPLRVLKGHTDWVAGVAIGPGGKVLASASADCTVRLWNIASGGLLRVLQGHTDWVTSVAFSPDGSLVASASHDTTIRLWDADSGTLEHVLKGHSATVRCVAVSPSGEVLASASHDTTIRLWDTASGAPRCVLTGHSDTVGSVAFGPDGRTLVSASADGTVRLWDVVKGACLAILLPLPEGWVAFTPTGRYRFGGNIAGGFWHAINLCRFEPGELDAFIPSLRIPDGEPLLPLRLRGS